MGQAVGDSSSQTLHEVRVHPVGSPASRNCPCHQAGRKAEISARGWVWQGTLDSMDYKRPKKGKAAKAHIYLSSVVLLKTQAAAPWLRTHGGLQDRPHPGLSTGCHSQRISRVPLHLLPLERVRWETEYRFHPPFGEEYCLYQKCTDFPVITP